MGHCGLGPGHVAVNLANLNIRTRYDTLKTWLAVFPHRPAPCPRTARPAPDARDPRHLRFSPPVGHSLQERVPGDSCLAGPVLFDDEFLDLIGSKIRPPPAPTSLLSLDSNGNSLPSPGSRKEITCGAWALSSRSSTTGIVSGAFISRSSTSPSLAWISFPPQLVTPKVRSCSTSSLLGC